MKQVWFSEQKGTIYVSKLFVEISLNFPITSWLKLNRGQQFLQFDWPTRKKSRKLKERAQRQIIPFFEIITIDGGDKHYLVTIFIYWKMYWGPQAFFIWCLDQF